MELYLLRHGEATPQESGVPDVERALTRRGRSDVRSVLKAAQRAGLAPRFILTSPLRRARETAAVAARLFGSSQVIASDRLKPAAAAKGIWTELGQLPDEPSVLLVGHDPHLSHLAAFLLEAPLVIDFKKAGLVRIDCSECTGPPRGVLKWIITPKLARAL